MHSQVFNKGMKAIQINANLGTVFSTCAAVLLLLTLLGSGCKPATNTAEQVTGTFNLVSVDGKTVPCTVTHEGASPTINSGTFVINPDGTCTSTVSFSMPGGASASRVVKATYTKDGEK